MIGSIILGALEIILQVSSRIDEHRQEQEAARLKKIADARKALEVEFKANAARKKAGM